LIPRSVRPERPLSPIIVEILRAVADEAERQGIDIMLVGATARDILLQHVFGLEEGRATYDVDFAVAVKDWEQFDALKAALVAGGRFKDDGRMQQRLYYKGGQGDLDYQIDLVPFGDIAGAASEIAWPPDMKIIMNMAGYDEVLKAAELVELEPGFVVKVVSLAGFAVLKIIAWSDRGRGNAKDVHDLFHLMDNYAGAGNANRVYDEQDAIEAADYDPDLAGVYLLGKDIARLASKATLDLLRQIIERDFHRLAIEMIKSRRSLDDVQELVESRLRLLQSGMAPDE
jgi:predicted nucleotidyltransferase